MGPLTSRDGVPQVSVWHSHLGDDVLRVMIEHRPRATARQFLELEKLVADCNADGLIQAVNASGHPVPSRCEVG